MLSGGGSARGKPKEPGSVSMNSPVNVPPVKGLLNLIIAGRYTDVPTGKRKSVDVVLSHLLKRPVMIPLE